MNKENDLSAEAMEIRDMFYARSHYKSLSKEIDDNVWQEMFELSISIRYRSLRSMQNAHDKLCERDLELLGLIREKVKCNEGIVDNDLTWHYKERIKVLKNKSKLSLKILKEKKRLNN